MRHEFMRRIIRKGAIAIGMAFAAATPWSAVADCLPWKSAAPVIAKNSLLPGNVIYDMVQKQTGGKIIHASLCDEGGRFFYKLTVLSPTGEVTNVSVDARTGRP